MHQQTIIKPLYPRQPHQTIARQYNIIVPNKPSFLKRSKEEPSTKQMLKKTNTALYAVFELQNRLCFLNEQIKHHLS